MDETRAVELGIEGDKKDSSKLNLESFLIFF
jgi:hypothetical protein